MQDNSDYTDAELLALLKEHGSIQAQAFNTIYFKYSGKLSNFCFFKCQNKIEAEDVFQETWMKFFASVKTGMNVKSILPFLQTISKNIYLKNKREKTLNIDTIYEDSNNIDLLIDLSQFQRNLEKNELRAILKLGVSYLDEKNKEIVIMRIYDDLSYKEISDRLGFSEQFVRNRFVRGIEKLKSIIKPFLEEKK